MEPVENAGGYNTSINYYYGQSSGQNRRNQIMRISNDREEPFQGQHHNNRVSSNVYDETNHRNRNDRVSSSGSVAVYKSALTLWTR